MKNGIVIDFLLLMYTYQNSITGYMGEDSWSWFHQHSSETNFSFVISFFFLELVPFLCIYKEIFCLLATLYFLMNL